MVSTHHYTYVRTAASTTYSIYLLLVHVPQMSRSQTQINMVLQIIYTCSTLALCDD